MQRLFTKRNTIAMFAIFFLTLICWIFALGQLINHYFSDSSRAIPAFLNEQTISCSVVSTPEEITDYLKQYDNSISLISCHEEKNYTDMYFYSPVLAKRFPENSCREFNLQVALTKDKVYFGNPIIQYDF
ncbi:MAG: hypothetical protein LUH14_06280 [Clostridiaceae bacterium]|nr:hypothetical protein [Clostridiaceae bacterium]